MTRARAISVIAVGALATGGVIAATTGPWARDASQVAPRPGAAPDRPGDAPLPPRAPLAPPPAALEPVATPVLAPVPANPPARTVWHPDGPGFLRTPWNTVGPVPPRVDGDEVTIHLTGRGQRSELEPDLPAVREGDVHDLTLTVRLDGAFPPGAAQRHVLARWENDGPGQAPLDLRVVDGELVLHGGEGHPSGPRTFTRVLGPAPIGEWTHLRVAVRFSADPDKARVSVWRDGRTIVDGDQPDAGTLYPGQQSYLKVGLHRAPTISRPSTARYREWRVEHGSDVRSGHETSPQRSAGPSDRDHRREASDAQHRQAPDRETSGRDVSARTDGQHSEGGRSSGHRTEEQRSTSRRGAEVRSPREDGTRSSRAEGSNDHQHDAGRTRGSSRDG